MKRTPFLVLLGITLVILLASCRPTGPGPASWIDKPLDMSSYPLEPLEIIAHASSEQGVKSIEFAVDDVVIDTVQVGGTRFERASLIWYPKEPDLYAVRVTALDKEGARGSSAVSLVYIGNPDLAGLPQTDLYLGDCESVDLIHFIADPPIIPPGECANLFWEVHSPEDVGIIVDGNPVPPFGEIQVCLEESRSFELIVEAPTGFCSEYQTVYVDEDVTGPQFVFFEAHPPLIQRGECSVLIWEIHPPGELLPRIDGIEVPYFGEMEVCPEKTSPYFLTSELSPELVAIVEVFDEGEAPGESTFTPDPLLPPTSTLAPDPGASSTPTQTPGSGPTDTPLPDTTPPQLSSASVSPDDFIYDTSGSCTPTYFQITVNVTDVGGISSVTLNWTGSGVRSGPEAMNYSGGGGVYFKNLGLFLQPGSLSGFSITATDNAGNSSTINPSWNLNVENCGG